MQWIDFAKLSANQYIMKHKPDWKWDRTQSTLYCLCLSSLSTFPEPKSLQSSKEGVHLYPSKEEAEGETMPGYYTTNSYQYQDTEL